MIKFSSDAAGSFDMLDAHAKELLRLAGRTPAERGAIAADEIESVLATLRDAIASQPKPPEPDADDEDDPEAAERAKMQVGIGQRAYPLIEMLQRAARKQKPVVWDRA